MNTLIEHELDEINDILEMAEVAEYLDNERFKIRDLESANWAFRKLKAIEEKVKETTELANKEIERISEWKEKEIEQIEKSKEFFEGLLIEYFAIEREKDPKFKINTPYGKVTARKQQPKWNYEEKKVIESLKVKGISHLIRTKKIEEIEKTELKKSVEILNDVVSLFGRIMENIKFIDGNFIDITTGEIEDLAEYKYHKQAVVYGREVIEGIEVVEQPEQISIKVAE